MGWVGGELVRQTHREVIEQKMIELRKGRRARESQESSLDLFINDTRSSTTPTPIPIAFTKFQEHGLGDPEHLDTAQN